MNLEFDAGIVAGLLLVLAIGYFGYVQYINFTPAFAEPDCDGYIFMAKRLAVAQKPLIYDADPFVHRSHFWVENPAGQITAKFAPGWPLLMVPAYLLGGEDAMFVINPIMGALTLLGTFLLLRRWLSDIASALGTAALAINPTFVFFAGYPLTHVAEIAFVTWGMHFLWGWLESTRRRAPRWGVAAGAALGMAVTVRYTGILLAAPILVAAVSRIAFAAGPWTAERRPWRPVVPWILDRFVAFGRWIGVGLWRDGWRPLASVLLAFAAFPAALMVYNSLIFGSPFRTGYALSDEQATFSVANFIDHFPILLAGANQILPLFFPLAVIGLIIRGRTADRALRIAWFLCIFLIYAAYYWAPPNTSYFRFIIATLPVLIGSAFMTLDCLPVGPGMRLGLMALFVVILGLSTVPAQATALDGKLYAPAHTNLRVDRHAAENLPDDAVIFTVRPFGDGLATRRDYRVYDLAAFNRNSVEEDLGGRYTPRSQPIRLQRRKAIYAASDDETLDHDLRALVRDFLAERRTVVFLVPTDRPDRLRKWRERLGPDFLWNEMGKPVSSMDPTLVFRTISAAPHASSFPMGDSAPDRREIVPAGQP
ncbi:MAG: glycosyltransferase family 39 protein [Planctomycetota bacterium]|nr:glycosyltransferase family 39 protein [Planctomycetota bacterium]